MTQPIDDPWDETRPPKLDEIGGWLWLPLFQLGANAAILVWRLYHLIADRLANSDTQSALAKIVAVFVTAPESYIFMFVNLCLVRFVQRRREVPTLMTVFYALDVVGLLMRWFRQASEPVLFVSYAVPATLSQVSLAIQLAMCGALIAYFHTSQRVAKTFVMTAPPPNGAAGIGGWLLVTLGLQAAWTGAVLIGFVMNLPTFPRRLAWSLQHHTLFPLRISLLLVLVAFSIYGLVCAVQRKRRAPLLLIGATASFFVLVSIASWSKLPAHWPSEALTGVLCTAVIVYFLRSHRVKNTFVR